MSPRDGTTMAPRCLVLCKRSFWITFDLPVPQNILTRQDETSGLSSSWLVALMAAGWCAHLLVDLFGMVKKKSKFGGLL